MRIFKLFPSLSHVACKGLSSGVKNCLGNSRDPKTTPSTRLKLQKSFKIQVFFNTCINQSAF